MNFGTPAVQNGFNAAVGGFDAALRIEHNNSFHHARQGGLQFSLFLMGQQDFFPVFLDQIIDRLRQLPQLIGGFHQESSGKIPPANGLGVIPYFPDRLEDLPSKHKGQQEGGQQGETDCPVEEPIHALHGIFHFSQGSGHSDVSLDSLVVPDSQSHIHFIVPQRGAAPDRFAGSPQPGFLNFGAVQMNLHLRDIPPGIRQDASTGVNDRHPGSGFLCQKTNVAPDLVKRMQ
ncbi:MAG: hypothetical protein A4E69_00552 [Syntrophus sp. PtaB.Bin138]|nr:MAG: hypothetical protein A4E69_00552 [Syntrophus sp. PtaB.Bin138]